MAEIGARISPVGPWTGIPGDSGPAGPPGMTDPVSMVNGMTNAGAWNPALPISGSYTPYSSPLSGGLGFGSVSASSVLSLSRHLSLYGGDAYGMNVASNALNYVSPSTHQFWSGGSQCIALTPECFYWQNDGWRWQHVGNNWFIYYNSASTPLYGFYNSQLTVWGNLYIVSMWLNPIGIIYANIVGTSFSFIASYGSNWGCVLNNGYYVYFDWNCDERLKEDIAPANFDCLEAVRRVHLFQFRWQDRTDPTHIKRSVDAPLVPVGFVAQSLQDDFPALLMPKREAEEHMSIDLNNTVASLVGAMQQLDAEITELENATA